MTEWQDRGACLGHDPDIWFPRRGADTSKAKAICAFCPVREDCLEYALATNTIVGIWGGKSDRERKRIRKQRLQIQGRAA